ncbi:MAG: hypothetical protein ACJ8BF_02990 [Gemmatimonadales bacterium]
MSESVIVALVALLGTISGALVSAFSTIRAAQVEAGRQPGQSGEEQARLQAVFASSRGRALRRAGGLALIIGLAGGFLANGLLSRIKEGVSRQILGDFSALKQVKAITISNFSDARNVHPWVAAKGTDATMLLDNKVAGKGDDGALRVTPALPLEPEGPVTGVRLEKGDLPASPIGIIVVWVYVDKDETADAADLRATLRAGAENQQGAFISTIGTEARLAPGAWTPVIWTRAGAVFFWDKGQPRVAAKEKCAFRENGERFTSVELVFSANRRPYNGSLYVDDARFYSLQ